MGVELAPDVRLEPAIGPITAAQFIDPLPVILSDFLGRLGDRIVTVGSDCCGLCAVYHALVKLGAAALPTGARMLVTSRPLDVEALRLLRKEKIKYGRGTMTFLAYERV